MLNVLMWENIQAALGKMNGVTTELIFFIIGVMFFTIIYEIAKMLKFKD